jgi:hypothetical protein
MRNLTAGHRSILLQLTVTFDEYLGVHMFRTSFNLLVAALAAVSFGCGGAASPKADSDDLPSWVLNPPALCASGIQKFRGNLGMAKTGAVAKGRDALARQFQVKVQGMLKSYQAEGGTDKGDFSEEDLTQVSRQLVDLSLTGTKARFVKLGKGDPQQLYALVCADFASMDKALNDMKQLGAKARAALKQRAKAEFDDLDKQLEKIKQ